ncbi:MAG: hypothetical protein ABSC94_24805 [Polyangiaceae bacterium]
MPSERRGPVVCGLVVCACVLAPRGARAESCPAPADAPLLADHDSEERLAFLGRVFDREVHDLDVWSWTWGSIYATAAVAQVATIPLVQDKGVHEDLGAGAVSAAIGSLSLFLLPLEITLPLRGARSDWADPRRCRLLRESETTLTRVEGQQRLSTGWLPHVGNVAFNAGLALVLGWGFGRWKSAAISAGVGTAVGELNILTQPHHLAEAIERYHAGKLDQQTAAPRVWSIGPELSRRALGLSLNLQW